MATPIARVQSVMTGLLGQAASNEILLRVADAYVFAASDDEVQQAFGKPKSALTNDEKALVILEFVRRSIKQAVRYQAEQVKVAEISVQVGQAGDAATQGL